MSKEKLGVNRESLELPPIKYSLDLPFGRLSVSNKANQSLNIVPLVPTIEDRVSNNHSKDQIVDNLHIVAVCLSELYGIEYSQYWADNDVFFMAVPDDLYNGAKDFIKRNISIYRDILGLNNDEINAFCPRFEVESGQDTAHKFAEQTAQSISKQILQHRKNIFKESLFKKLRSKAMFATLGSGALAMGINDTSIRTLGVSLFVSYMGFRSYKDVRTIENVNSPTVTEPIENDYYLYIYDAVHEAYCAKSLEERILGEDLDGPI